ncbi:MAG TPA: hypothetical protein VGI67_00555 [Thermoleophilaceae bacterium]
MAPENVIEGASAQEVAATVDGATTNGDAAAAAPTLVSGVGDDCANCRARLAPEQRYCVECGERRGAARLPFAEGVAQRTQTAAAPPPRKRGPRLTSNGALIAGIGTLILALGVGVLIGRSGNSSSNKNQPAQVIRVGGAAAAAGTAGTGTTTASTSGSGKSKKSSKGGGGSKSKASALSKQTVQPKGSSVPPPAVKVGSPGHGKGYKNGKFTGQFFGQ